MPKGVILLLFCLASDNSLPSPKQQRSVLVFKKTNESVLQKKHPITLPGLSQLSLRLKLWHDSMGSRLGQITEGQLAVFCHQG